MDTFTNEQEGIIFRLKKSKLKINASLSAICTKLDLIPTKVLSGFEASSKEVPIQQEKFFVKLVKTTENTDGFKLKIIEGPDSDFLRSLKKQYLNTPETDEKLKKEILQYAIKTMNKSLCKDPSSRVNELIGHYRSFR